MITTRTALAFSLVAACAADTTADLCLDPGVLAPHAVQGPGAASPLDGENVAVEGVVVGDFEGHDQLGGFFVQSLQADRDPATSEGLFVFDPGRDSVTVGDRIRVRGRVREVLGRTELAATAAPVRCGRAPVPTPVTVVPSGDAGALEPYEGMVVVPAAPMTVTSVFGYGRQGRLVLASGGRLVSPTNGSGGLPDAPRLGLDDGSLAEPPKHLSLRVEGRLPRVGDIARTVIGALDVADVGWFIQPTAPVVLEVGNERSAAPAVNVPESAGGMRIVAFNALNYFTTLGRRGAATPDALALQEAKIVAALNELDADIIGLVEIENDGGEALRRLVAALATASGDPWAAVPAPVGGQGTDTIRVALAYRGDRVRLSGSGLAPDDPVFAGRSPLGQTFAVGEHRFGVVVAHLKSKGGCDRATGPDRDQGDGQGCWNDLRTRQAHRLRDFVATMGEVGETREVLLVGDLNSYGAEDPILALRGRGLVDLLAEHVRAPQRYSYVYRGAAGLLDYALATPDLQRRVASAAIWHINADESPALDYRQGPGLGLAARDPYRSSDHDPVIVDLRFPAAEFDSSKRRSWLSSPTTRSKARPRTSKTGSATGRICFCT